ncbi:MAG: glycosyltransferase [Verrucomicrobiota bacterium]
MLQFDCGWEEKIHTLLKYFAYRRIEAIDYQCFDRLWVVGSEDRDTLASRSSLHVKRITIPVDPEYFDFKSRIPEENAVSFRCIIGTAMYIRDFARDISLWIASEVPDEVLSGFEFVGCGPEPIADLQDLLNRIGYRHFGWVPNYAEFIQTASIFIYPQRVGSGIQNKVIQAMAMGMVCILSKEVASATGVSHECECLVVQKPEDVWPALSRLRRDWKLMQLLSINARNFCDSQFSFASVSATLKGELSEIIS